MMSQQRIRKAGGVAVEARGRSVVKASGDSMPSNVQNKQPTVRSTSKNKLPKSLRYDLENALVGLCDVWFEEIKPHLVRNNIKVHVHSEAGSASGDHQRLPPGAPGCSHLDPALSAGVCELCRLLFNAANSIESAVSQATSAVPLPGLPAACLVAGEASGFPAAFLRPEPTRPGGTLPIRKCLAAAAALQRAVELEVQAEAQIRDADRTHHHRRPKTVDKTTQTPTLRKPEIVPREQESRIQQLIRQEILRQELERESYNKLESYKQELSWLERSKLETSRAKASSPSCLRCPATTMLCSPRRGSKQSPAPPSTLFQEDLIHIIAEQNDKQLQLLFKSPTREDRTSSLNLFQRPMRHASGAKRVPWR